MINYFVYKHDISNWDTSNVEDKDDCDYCYNIK